MKSEKSKLFTLNSTENILKLKGKSSSLDLKDKVTISRYSENISDDISTSTIPNNYESSCLIDDSNMNMNKKEWEINIKDNSYYPLCNLHQKKAYFYYFKNKEKKYVCLFCIENDIVKNENYFHYQV